MDKRLKRLVIKKRARDKRLKSYVIALLELDMFDVSNVFGVSKRDQRFVTKVLDKIWAEQEEKDWGEEDFILFVREMEQYEKDKKEENKKV